MIKAVVKRLLPSFALAAIRRRRSEKIISSLHSLEKDYLKLSTAEVFRKIYSDKAWGSAEDPGEPFFSGSGSHNAEVAGAYVKSVRKFLSSFSYKPGVVDLGCGDFGIGSSLRDLCGEYTACDIVEPLVEFNRNKYYELNVDFRTLDLCQDDLPKGEVVFIRQVLQHLSNQHIRNAIRQIEAKYKYLILTEHLPSSDSFIHNVDKPNGPGNRLALGSGVVVTSPPFNLAVKSKTPLCSTSELGGVIKTCVYELA